MCGVLAQAHCADSPSSSTPSSPALILSVRAAFDQQAIRIASAQVANISGDVRKALQICRRAAEIAANRALSAAAAAAGDGGGVGAGAGSSSAAAPTTAGKAVVGVLDINAAAKALSSGLTSQALLAARPWERLLLVALAAHLASNVCEEVHADAVIQRALGYCARVKGEYPVSAAAAKAAKAAAAAAAAPAEEGGDDGDGAPATSTFTWDEHDGEAVLLDGYRTAPTEAQLLSTAYGLGLTRLVHVDVRPGWRRPWLRLNIQADDVRSALRDDPLVKMFLADVE